MAEEWNARFEQATKDVTALSQAPDIPTKLRLYALFKQSTAGDCTSSRPGLLDMAGRAKYDAWKAMAGQTKEEAMQAYVALTEELKAADRPA